MEQKDQVRDYIEYEEVGVPSHIRRTKRPSCMERPSKFSILMVVLFILAGVANIGAWLWITRGHRDALDEEWNHCGRSSEEAMQRGCVMEPLFYGWMPKQCVYKELSDRYPVFEDRKWYLEKDMINEVESEALWRGSNIKVYTHIYHGEHCLFQWRKIMFAINNHEQYIDNKTISIHHSSHCADQLTVGREGDDAINEVELGFYRCRNTIWAS
ncbi:hypothetical protein TsFJ059_008049 [Trichoderma semiorbis]|uniref:Uncharacterized protein n=1 Tax=Trichoderma semiorbis TaxID=1491008 RepID=A0A9P8HDB0_9HYPO|nr:hypothetical protein TsFJ059_008049 [Trichoderma semiorbis]